MKPLVRRYPLTAFLLLAFGISWSSALLHGPELLVGAGPLLAALVCQWCLAGYAGVGHFLRNTFQPRMNEAAWLLAVIAPLAILTTAILIGYLRQGDWPQWRANVTENPSAFFALLLLVAWNGPGEEPGWRGFALPRLLARHGPLVATLLIAAMWVPWHYPMLYVRGELTLVMAGAFSVALLFGAVWLTAIYRLSGGSVFACIVWHALWNVVASIGRNLSPSVFPWMGGLVAVLAIGLLVWQREQWRAPQVTASR